MAGVTKTRRSKARIILAVQVLAQFSGQGAFRAIGDHLDRVDEVFALRTKLAIALALWQVFERHFARGVLALVFQAIVAPLGRVWAPNWASKAAEPAAFAPDALLQPTAGGIDHAGGFRKRLASMLDQAV